MSLEADQAANRMLVTMSEAVGLKTSSPNMTLPRTDECSPPSAKRRRTSAGEVGAGFGVSSLQKGLGDITKTQGFSRGHSYLAARWGFHLTDHNLSTASYT